MKLEQLPESLQAILRDRFMVEMREQFNEIEPEIRDAFLQGPTIAAQLDEYREYCWQEEVYSIDMNGGWEEWLRERGIEP